MMFKQLKTLGVLLFLGFALAAAYNLVGSTAKASALHGSVIISTGEWTSSGGASGMAIPTSVNTAGEFKTFIYNLLHNTAAAGDPGSDYNKYGAAFLVENMMNGKTEYSANAALVSDALTDYSAWAGYIDDYSSAGRVQWAVSKSVAAGSFNSTHTCIEGSGGYCWARATYYNNNYNGGGYDAKHFDFYTLDSAEPSTLIIFTNPDGTTFQIRRECGNVIGSASKLRELGWNLNGRSYVSGATTIYAGQSTAFTNQLMNTGSSDANTVWTVQYCYDDCTVFGNITNGSDPKVVHGVTWKTEYIWSYSAPGYTTHYRVCTRINYTNGNGPGTAQELGPAACATIIPLESECGSVTVTPALLGTTDSYTIHATVNTSEGSTGAGIINSNSTFYIDVTAPNYGSYHDVSATVGNGTLSATLSQPPTGSAGDYTISYGIAGTIGLVGCIGHFTVAYRPYVSVLGGDVTAGSGYGSSCSGTAADINSWNLNTSTAPNYFGGGTEQAAWATGSITNFVSGMGLSGGAASSGGYGLSLSNTSNIGGANHGGDFGTNAIPCIYDYYGNRPASMSSGMPGSTLSSVSGIASGSYSPATDGSGTYTIWTGSSAVPLTIDRDAAGNGKQIDVYVNGNLYIRSNIMYQSYANTNQIPKIAFYVKGSIYIDPSVTELHGVYIAQKTSGTSGGYVYTCEPGVTAAVQSYTTCYKQLQVVGAVSAENGLRLNRTYGDLVQSGSVTADPAEVFQYSPELWLAQPVINGLNYQAYTSLTPVL